MRVIIYSYEYPPLGGGVGNAISHILPRLAKHDDLQIDFVTSALDDKLSVENIDSNLTFHRIPIGEKPQDKLHKQRAGDMIRYTLAATNYTRTLLREHEYDLNIFFGFPGGLVSLLYKWKMPYIVSLRGIEVPGYSPKYKQWYWLYRPLAWMIWGFATRVVANSSGLKKLARQTRPQQHIEIITNGVDTDKFTPSVDKFEQFTVTAGATILGKIKGLDQLVRGFAKFHQHQPQSQLMLIGSGDYESELRQLVEELGIAEATKFVGRKDHNWIAANLPKCHVLCLPSLNEGMSNAMLEGLACGLPLIITEVGGSDELVEPGVNGYIVPKHDSASIANALLELSNDRDSLVKFGTASRSKAEKMSWDQVAAKYYRLIEQVYTNAS